MKVVQETLPQDAQTPAIHLQLTWLLPSESLMLWASTGSAKFGSMSVAMAAAGNAAQPALKTRITGMGSDDRSERLALLLSRRHKRQCFVSLELAPTAQEDVLRKIAVRVAALLAAEPT